ncbi:hypothetical protein HanRHA438_Chr05g0240291 [Helianthus annuus]|nr:hypothetical protein HanRHA438_Chr05g0240291 [Helianthus annuus]
MFKPNFPPPMKFLFHTLLTCLSNKTTAFNEIPLILSVNSRGKSGTVDEKIKIRNNGEFWHRLF